ncbi:MAG: hypothetical protein ACRCX7_11380 [Cetobacterium sp.]|uniref:hypothetical protein n=1 Tax=Cetobacterium sp. TaxID=2071632 RepID=UPI003F377792
MMMSFEDFYNKVKEIIELQNKANDKRDQWDDYGARPGCDCGCGGDTFPWDAQAEAFEESDQLDREAEEKYEELKEYYEGIEEEITEFVFKEMAR